MSKKVPDTDFLLENIIELHELIRREVTRACREQSTERLSAVHSDDEGDTIYEIDRVSDDLLIDFVTEKFAASSPIVLIAEGIMGGKVVLPEGASESDAPLRMIIDPIDGTRGLMHQKRSAWVLTGVAENKGDDTTLDDIFLAVQTEVPLVKQYLCDQLWAIRGNGMKARRYDMLKEEYLDIELKPSRAESLLHGYAYISRFFPGARDVLAAIDEEIIHEVLGPPPLGKALCFEDQYVCSGGQLYELMSGHDRFIADLRPLMNKELKQRGMPDALCCHPYDLCTALIALEAGVIVTDPFGKPFDAPFNVEADVAWAGYASRKIFDLVKPALLAALDRRNLLGIDY